MKQKDYLERKNIRTIEKEKTILSTRDQSNRDKTRKDFKSFDFFGLSFERKNSDGQTAISTSKEK